MTALPFLIAVIRPVDESTVAMSGLEEVQTIVESGDPSVVIVIAGVGVYVYPIARLIPEASKLRELTDG
jgi:hypothetical protein